MKIKLLILLNLIALNCYGLDPAIEKILRCEIEGGHVGEVTKILNNGIDVNSFLRSFGQPSLLAYAAKIGAFNVAELLILRGADVNLKNLNNCYGHSPLRYALANNNYNIAEMLLQNGAVVDNDLLYSLALEDKNKVKFLFAHGFKISQKDPISRTILNNPDIIFYHPNYSGLPEEMKYVFEKQYYLETGKGNILKLLRDAIKYSDIDMVKLLSKCK